MEPTPGTKEYAEKTMADVNLRDALYALNRAMTRVTVDDELKAIRDLRDATWQLGADMFGWKD